MSIGVQKKSSNAFCAFSLTFFFFPQTHSSFYNHIHSLEKYKTAQRSFDVPAFVGSLLKNYQLFLYLGFSMIIFFLGGGRRERKMMMLLACITWVLRPN